MAWKGYLSAIEKKGPRKGEGEKKKQQNSNEKRKKNQNGKTKINKKHRPSIARAVGALRVEGFMACAVVCLHSQLNILLQGVCATIRQHVTWKLVASIVARTVITGWE